MNTIDAKERGDPVPIHRPIVRGIYRMIREKNARTQRQEVHEELQSAFNVAYALLLLDMAHDAGLITGGPTVMVETCVSLLRRARSLELEPCRQCVERIITGALDPEAREAGLSGRLAARLFEEVTLIY